MTKTQMPSLRYIIAGLGTALIALFLFGISVKAATVVPQGNVGAPVRHVAASADGKYVALYTWDDAARKGKIFLYKVEADGSWTLIRDDFVVLDGVNPVINRVIFSPCLHENKVIPCLLVYEGSGNGRALLFDAATGKYLRTLVQSNTGSSFIDVVPGAVLGAGDGQPAIAYEIDSLDKPKRPPYRWRGALVISDAAGKPLASPVPVHIDNSESAIADVAFGPSKPPFIATIGGTGKQYICIVTGVYKSGKWTWTCSKQIALTQVPHRIDVSQESGLIVIANSQGEGALIVNKDTGKKTELLGRGSGAIQCIFLEKDVIACGLSSGAVLLLDTKGNRLSDEQVCPSGVSVTAIGRGLNNSIYYGCKDGTIGVLQTASGTPAPSGGTPKVSSTPTSTPTATVSVTPTPTPMATF